MSNVTRPKQFETSEQIGRTLADLDAALADAAQATSRLERLRGKLAGEIAEILEVNSRKGTSRINKAA